MPHTDTLAEQFNQVTSPIPPTAASKAWAISLEHVTGEKTHRGRAAADLLDAAAAAVGRSGVSTGGPRAQLTDGDWAVRLGGTPLRDENGYPFWFATAGEAAEFGRLWGELYEAEQVWVLTSHDTARWEEGIAGPRVGRCPTSQGLQRLVFLRSTSEVKAVSVASIKPRLTDAALHGDDF